MEKWKPLVAMISLFIASGCAINQKITYKTTDIPKEPEVRKIVLDIQPLMDERQSLDTNKILFENGRETLLNDRKMCINSEKHYESGTVSAQISTLIVEHLNQKQFLDKIVLNNKEIADYYLTGKLRQFYGEQEFSMKALVGSQFGLIGALATSGIQTQSKFIISISDLELHDKNGSIVSKLDDVNTVYEGMVPADGYCWSIYRNINDKLKMTVEKLAIDLKASIEKLN